MGLDLKVLIVTIIPFNMLNCISVKVPLVRFTLHDPDISVHQSLCFLHVQLIVLHANFIHTGSTAERPKMLVGSVVGTGCIPILLPFV